MDPALHARAKRIIDEVLDLPDTQRAAALDRACAGDAPLRAHIDALIAAIRTDDRFLSDPTMSGEPIFDEINAPRAADAERPGSRIGPYKILERIGEGGFGVVFMAEQSVPIHRRVALKIIKLGMDTRAVVARFEQERQALAMMDHPNIARVLDAGATDSGRPYFAMELVKGRPITEFADAESLPIADRLDLFVQVCRAVQHAHTKGVIHRDIKPTNILVAMSDGRPLCKVIDFGIAKAMQRPLTDKTIFTEFRQLVGTPEYMSPEQAAGSLDIDTRTDIYSLGVLLYELLAGVTPFDPRQLRSAAFAELQRIIREVDPPPPSTRLAHERDTLASVAALRRVEPARLSALIRGELDWIVMRALDKDRARRYDTAGNLAADVSRFLSGKPVEAAPSSAAYRLRKWVRRNKGVTAAAALVAAALVAGFCTTLWQYRLASHERDLARAAAAEAERRSRETDQIAAFQSSQLGQIDASAMGLRIRTDLLESAALVQARDGLPDQAIRQRTEQLSALLADANFTDVALRTLQNTYFERAIAAARTRFQNQPVVRAQLLGSIGHTMRELGMLDKATSPLRESLEIRRREFGDDDRRTLVALSAFATLRMLQGATEEGQSLFNEVIRRSTAVLGPDDSVTLNALNNQALGLIHIARYEDAEKILIPLRAARLRVAPSLPDEGALMATANLALAHSSRGRLADAEPLWQECIADYRTLLGPDHRDTIACMANYSNDLFRTGRREQAQALATQCLDIMRKRFGEDHPDTINGMRRIGQNLKLTHDYAAAAKIDRDCLDACRRTFGNEHHQTLISMKELGDALTQLGRPEEALPYLQQSLEIQERRLGRESLPTTLTRASFGITLTDLKRFQEAETQLLLTERILQNSGHASNGAIHRLIAEMYEGWNKAEPDKGHDAQARRYRDLWRRDNATEAEPDTPPFPPAPAATPTLPAPATP